MDDLGHHWPQWVHSLYWVISKPIFIGGMFLTVLPSILGCRHSFFATILTAKVLHFIARISFCTYLVHLFVLYYFLCDRSYDIYYSLIDMFTFYLGVLAYSLFFGFLLTMVIEVPFANLVRVAFPAARPQKKEV
jgi:peptidoglycan/LPS O-acetylase OafA/YrhL